MGDAHKFRLRSGPTEIAVPAPMKLVYDYSAALPADAVAFYHFVFTLRYVTADPRARNQYAVYGQPRGGDTWEIVDGPWRIGQGPYDGR